MKKGISLVALIITIIVLMVLTAVVINNFIDNKFAESANKARFQNDISLFREELTTNILNEKIEKTVNNEEFNEKTIILDAQQPQEFNTIKANYIPSLTDNYKDKIKIIEGKLIYVYEDDNSIEKIWSEEIGIETEKKGSVVQSETENNTPESTGTALSDWVIETISGTNDLRIIGYNGTKLDNLVIPNRINGNIVKEIGNIGNYPVELSGTIENITGKLTISDGIKVNIHALLLCNNITEVNIGKNCIIEAMSISNRNVNKVTIGDNTRMKAYNPLIDEGPTFANSNIQILTIGKNCKIEEGSFWSCTKLSSLTIGDGCDIGSIAFSTEGNECVNLNIIGKLFNLGEGAFSGRNIITQGPLEFMDNSEIEKMAFALCTFSNGLKFGDGVEFAQDSFDSTYINGNIVIGNGSNINERAFYCNNVEMILLGNIGSTNNGITIANDAFSCTNSSNYYPIVNMYGTPLNESSSSGLYYINRF